MTSRSENDLGAVSVFLLSMRSDRSEDLRQQPSPKDDRESVKRPHHWLAGFKRFHRTPTGDAVSMMYRSHGSLTSAGTIGTELGNLTVNTKLPESVGVTSQVTPREQPDDFAHVPEQPWGTLSDSHGSDVRALAEPEDEEGTVVHLLTCKHRRTGL